MQVTGVDHVVLRVADPEVSLGWYCERLGLTPERVGEWRAGEVPFPSARVHEGFVIDFLSAGDHPPDPMARNVDHLALVVDGVDLAELAADPTSGFDVVGGPAELWGARGTGFGVYIRDPDGHIVELRTYTTP